MPRSNARVCTFSEASQSYIDDLQKRARELPVRCRACRSSAHRNTRSLPLPCRSCRVPAQGPGSFSGPQVPSQVPKLAAVAREMRELGRSLGLSVAPPPIRNGKVILRSQSRE
jgi:hypothetical protein